MTLSVFLLLLPLASSLSNFPIIKTSYGAVRGYEYRALNGFVAQIFKKLPFAAPPTGQRRWKKSEPPEPWNYTIDGTFFGPSCAQVPSTNKFGVTGFSEDCLTVNIYTSKQCRESKVRCPVILWIHGGVGVMGGAAKFPDEPLVTNFASQGIVFVTVQYRLGPFGTLALGDENVVPANLGLHDVVESLVFLSKEIRAFGGDKDQICIMGMSSGANIVLTLVFSRAINKPGDPPLFARAISQSGSAVYETEEKQVSVSHGMAAKVGCAGSAREIMDCLLALDTDAIVQAAYEQGGIDTFSATQLSGVTNAGELMPIRSMRELRDRQKDHMSGLENPTHVLFGTLVNEYGREAIVNDSRVFASNGVLGVLNVDECNQKYWNDVKSGKFTPGNETISQSVFLTTALFAQAQTTAGGEVYVYQLDFPQFEHSQDMRFTVKESTPQDENEAWLSRIYSLYFVNFAKGLPLAPDWTSFNPELMNYYSINKSFTEGVVPRMKFGYHREIVEYYKEMQEFDDALTAEKRMVFNAPMEYESLNFVGSFQDFWDSLTFINALILFSILIAAIVLFCSFFQRSRKLSGCCRSENVGCEHEPLLLG